LATHSIEPHSMSDRRVTYLTACGSEGKPGVFSAEEMLSAELPICADFWALANRQAEANRTHARLDGIPLGAYVARAAAALCALLGMRVARVQSWRNRARHHWSLP
jgi:hypothetical protein